MGKTKKKIGVIIFVVAIAIFLSCFSVGYFFFLHPSLRDFEVKGIKTTNEQVVIEFEKVHLATKYEVTVYDEDENEVYTGEVTGTEIVLENLNVSHNEKLTAEVVAYDRNSEEKKSINDIEFVWQIPTISKNNTYYVKENSDLPIIVDGNILNQEYKLKLYYENKTFYETIITTNNIIIPSSVLVPFSGRIIATIETDNLIVSQRNFFVNTTLVSDIEIMSPSDGLYSEWDDINFVYTGGFGATEVYINVYKNNKFYKKLNLENTQTIIDAYEFEPNNDYRLELRAVYKDYEEIAAVASTTLKIGGIIQVSPVYVDKNPDNIKTGTKVSLNSNTPKVTIKYTTNGKDPIKYGEVYTGPIEINSNVTVKAYAYREGTIPSTVTTYKFNIGEKVPVVYLSPSKQINNVGAKGSGYTTEYEMMNKLTDYIEAKLVANNIAVYRNDPNYDMDTWTAESRKIQADLHFAIHSNGSRNHDAQGVEVWVHDEDSKALSIASNLYDAVYNIYPYQNPLTNRGLKYADGSLGEVHPTNVKAGVLIEIGFHDYLEDAIWVTTEMERIGNSLADSIINYFN